MVRMHSPERERQRDRKLEIIPRGDGHAVIPSSPFSFWDLGHTHARHEFKPPGLGLEPQLTTWESNNIAITLTSVSPLCSAVDSLCVASGLVGPLTGALLRKQHSDCQQKTPPHTNVRGGGGVITGKASQN